MNKKETIKFEAYVCYKKDEKGKECFSDISELLENIKNVPLEKRTINYMGEKIRMDIISTPTLSDDRLRNMGNGKLKYFHVTRLRKEGIAKTQIKKTDLESLDLDSDEFIAEDIGVIYDTALNAVCIQRNFHSLSIKGVAYYLNKMNHKIKTNNSNNQKENENPIYFKPVCDKKMLINAKKITNYRGLELSYATSNDIPDKKTMLSGVLPSLRDVFSGLNGEKITIYIGAKKLTKKFTNSLNSKEMQNIIDDIDNNKTIFNRAVIKGKEGDAPVEIYDLLNGKLTRKIKFSTVTKDGKRIHLRADSVLERLLDNYFGNDSIKNPFRDEIRKNL